MKGKGHYINNRWVEEASDSFYSINPANNATIWEGYDATESAVAQAVASAKTAYTQWSRLESGSRIEYLLKYERALKKFRDDLALTISTENGKPLWESTQEVTSMIEKIPVSINAYLDRCKISSKNYQGYNAVITYRPIGVMVVLGPYNFPGHLPHGHIIPALLAGNTVVFKPSELTPKVGEKMMELWEDCALPPGVINMVQGRGQTGGLLASHPDINGLLFTGSYETGKKIHQAFGGSPEKILALEMGGNNPLIVWDFSNSNASCYYSILSAFISTGQRCTCARRIIVPDTDEAKVFLEQFRNLTTRISIGAWDERPDPFMGPLIRETAAEKILKEFNDLNVLGGNVYLQPEILANKNSRAFISPGIIDMTGVNNVPDREIFGPVVQVYRAPDFNEAIDLANNTDFGLSAGLISPDQKLFETFLQRSRVGIINWNRQITGASSSLPFGGVGKSGNFQPAAYFSTDYCSYSVASLQSPSLEMPSKINAGLDIFK